MWKKTSPHHANYKYSINSLPIVWFLICWSIRKVKVEVYFPLLIKVTRDFPRMFYLNLSKVISWDGFTLRRKQTFFFLPSSFLRRTFPSTHPFTSLFHHFSSSTSQPTEHLVYHLLGKLNLFLQTTSTLVHQPTGYQWHIRFAWSVFWLSKHQASSQAADWLALVCLHTTANQQARQLDRV